MARMTQSQFRILQSRYPHYVSGADSDLSEFECLQAVADRQANDLEAAEAIIESLTESLRKFRASAERLYDKLKGH